MSDTDYFTMLIRLIAESRRRNPGTAGLYLDLSDASQDLTRAMTGKPASDVRDQALDVAAAALRIAIESCASIDQYRASVGLDALESRNHQPKLAGRN